MKIEQRRTIQKMTMENNGSSHSLHSILDPFVEVVISFLPQDQVYESRMLSQKIKGRIDSINGLAPVPRLIRYHPHFREVKELIKFTYNSKKYYAWIATESLMNWLMIFDAKSLNIAKMVDDGGIHVEHIIELNFKQLYITTKNDYKLLNYGTYKDAAVGYTIRSSCHGATIISFHKADNKVPHTPYGNIKSLSLYLLLSSDKMLLIYNDGSARIICFEKVILRG